MISIFMIKSFNLITFLGYIWSTEKKLINSTSSSKAKWKSLKNSNDLKLKNELETVYIDSSGKKYLDYVEALCAEAQIQTYIKAKLKQKEKIMNIVELIMQILKSENWGVFYKNQPIQPLEMQDGNALYKVNQVDESEVETAIEKALTKDEPWESSKTDSSQNNNSTTG